MDPQPIVVIHDTNIPPGVFASPSSPQKKDEPQSMIESKQDMDTECTKTDRTRPQIYTEVTGPEWHKVTSGLVTKPIIASNLTEAFKSLPIFGRPTCKAQLKGFQDQKLRKFMGLPDDEFEKVMDYCSPDNLTTGKEMEMASQRPTQGLLAAALALREEEKSIIALPEEPKLNTHIKLKARIQNDYRNIFPRKLKYRGVRLLATANQDGPNPDADKQPPDMEPGKDILYRVRIYRPFFFSPPGAKTRDGNHPRGRHSVFNYDVVVAGRQRLTELQERFVCRNDLDLRTDMSHNPTSLPPFNSKESFPSNFMFINNVFYVDTRGHCKDLSVVVRRFAQQRGLGSFPARDMAGVTLADLHVRLAHPEVYVHQGNCEHIFQFSEIRLLNTWDALHLSKYPSHSATSQVQTLYCSTCAEFSARWIVTGSQRVPFDPAFFCDTCFHSYMYVDGRKMDDFKAFHYKGNEINMLRPNMDAPAPAQPDNDDSEMAYEVRCDPCTAQPGFVFEVTPLR